MNSLVRGAGFLLDVSPLREVPDYRRLWLGRLLSSVGNQMTVFAIMLQVYEQTHSPLAVGAIGLFKAVPAIAMALWGGSLADRIDKRTLLFCATSLQMCMSFGLLWHAHARIDSLSFLYAASCFQFLMGALNVPTINSLEPMLVGPTRLVPTMALQSFSVYFSMISGPILGGILAGRFGLTALYMVDIASFVCALYAIARLPSMGAGKAVATKTWVAVWQGVAFVASSPKVRGALAVDFALAFFGVPMALLPTLNNMFFSGGQEVLGWMYAAPSVGGLLASLASGRLAGSAQPGRLMAISCLLWSVMVSALAIATALYGFLACLVCMGAFDAVVQITRGSIIQQATPNDVRGRVSALEYVVATIAPQLGNVRAGLMATALPVTSAVALSGLTTLCIVLFLSHRMQGFAIRSTAKPQQKGA